MDYNNNTQHLTGFVRNILTPNITTQSFFNGRLNILVQKHNSKLLLVNLKRKEYFKIELIKNISSNLKLLETYISVYWNLSLTIFLEYFSPTLENNFDLFKLGTQNLLDQSFSFLNNFKQLQLSKNKKIKVTKRKI